NAQQDLLKSRQPVPIEDCYCVLVQTLFDLWIIESRRGRVVKNRNHTEILGPSLQPIQYDSQFRPTKHGARVIIGDQGNEDFSPVEALSYFLSPRISRR